MNNPFSQRISDVIQFSKEEANRLRNNYIGPEHLLLGLIREGEGKAVQILKDLYVDLEMVKKTLENDLRSSAVTPENYSEDITFDEKASKILKMSILESRILKSPATDTEHMLLAIMRENQNKASQILEENEVTYQKVMDKLVPKAEPQSGLDFGEDEEEEEEGIRRQPTGNGESSFFSQEAKQTTRTQQQKPNNDTPVLDSFGTDMTKAASEGKLDPIVGREKEIERLAQILSRRKKNNPILIGEPGVGKSAIVEGLALRIIEKKVSRILFDKRVIALDMTAVVAGTKYRGQFEERIRAILNELKKNPNIILFIDEIHRLNRAVEEILYPAMEDYAIDIIIGKGPSANSIRLDLPRFTLIGATTRAGQLSSPLRDRFGVQLRLELYTNEELSRIVTRSAALLGIDIDPMGALEIASRSRGTPRIANRLLRRVRDFAQVYHDGVITKDAADHALGKLEVDHLGLDAIDRRMLTAIIRNYGGGPVGLETLAATIGEEAVTLEDVYEPYLMQIGFLTRTPRGRCVTQLAYEHLHLPVPQSAQVEQLSF